MRRIGALALCLLATQATPGRGEGLGRLFFSPAEREALEAERRAAATRATAVPAAVRIDGYLLRAGREGVVWVNGTAGRLRPERETQHGAAAEVILGPQRARIPVGATLESSRERARDLVEPGALSVRR